MAKKKKSQPKDDLIDQLLSDANGIAGDPSLAGSTPDIMKSIGPLKTDDDAPLEPTRAAFDPAQPSSPPRGQNESSPWDSLEQGLDVDSRPIEDLPSAEESVYDGPSAGEGAFQGLGELDLPGVERFESAEGHEHEATRPMVMGKSLSISTSAVTDHRSAATGVSQAVSDHEATVAADGFAKRRAPENEPQEKVVIGSLRGGNRGNVFTAMDASLAQAENLKIAQQKILDLEKENDRLRQENEEVSSAADIIRHRLEELMARITQLDREKRDIEETAQNELMILKGNLQFKESEVAKARLKIDELDTRLRSDFKKIRVKERELENRLELARAEKIALVRAKDENILELKRKIDQLQSETDNYREKCLELNKTIAVHQEQFRRTVRALRLALTGLEAKDDNLVALKKAE
ncbi:MAG: hypothetical protein KF802_12600 [Bdellovibrionaceae bacterium]|nr:hypothetical protein [Pseudobdellovibrionaceae bacterium]MBX3034812.1 hypothetical protein [Pseudobdellovibrionaceae bacterium]